MCASKANVLPVCNRQAGSPAELPAASRKDLHVECGDLSPLSVSDRLVGQTEPRYSGSENERAPEPIDHCREYGDKSPAESGDKSPHSKDVATGSGKPTERFLNRFELLFATSTSHSA
jgi:hypothetical protein